MDVSARDHEQRESARSDPADGHSVGHPTRQLFESPPYEERLEAARAIIAASAKLVAATRTDDPRLDLESLGGRILRAVTQRSWVSIAGLADMADVSSTAISKAVAILERKGLVARRQHPDGNLRRKTVFATEAGLRTIADIEDERSADAANFLFYYQPDDLVVLNDSISLLDHLAHGAAVERRRRRGLLVPARWL